MTDVQTPIFPSNDYEPVAYEADGSTTDFAIPWPYLGRINYDGSKSPYINVYTFNVATSTVTPIASSAWTMPTSTSIRLATAPASGLEVWIYRDSGANGRAVDYASGSTVDEETLDLDSLQTWYMLQELNANARTVFANTETVFPLPEFEFKGSDGPTFRLDDGVTAVNLTIAASSVWLYKNGVMAQTDDISIANVDPGNVVEITYSGELDADDDILVRIAQQKNLAIDLGEGAVTTTEIDDGSVTFEKLDLDGEGTDKQVAGWTGTGGTFGPNSITHEWVSDFDTGVQENRLDQMAAPTSNVSMNSNKLTNLSPGTADTDAATIGQLPSSSTSARFEVDVNVSSYPYTVTTGLPNGVYAVFLRMETGGGFSSGSSYTMTLEVNGVERDHFVGNHPDGRPGMNWPIFVTVTDGSITINSWGSQTSFQGAIGYRIASS